MAKYVEGFRTEPVQNLYLDGVTRGIGGVYSGSILFFDAQTGSDPISASTSRGVFVDSSNRLSYWNGTSTTRLTGAGGVATTWEDIYSVDATFALTGGTWTITQGGAFALLTLNKTNVGAGAVIAITNSGSGVDIGNGTTWTLSVAGAVGVLELTSGGTINATGGALTIGAAATATTLAGRLVVTGTGATNSITLTSGHIIASSGNLVLTSGNATLTAGNVVLTLGTYSQTYSTNANTFIITNNTITTIGNASSTGMFSLVSTSMTTGALVNLELTEGTLAGGYYLQCWDATANSRQFSIAEDGLVTILGIASGGSNSLVLTAGDFVSSDGSIAVTDADNAASLSVTNNTATTASVFVLAGSGVFTGTTTTSFLTLTASGLTTGTVMFAPAAALTTGRIFHATANALTTGTLFALNSTSAVFTSGQFVNINWNPATYTGAGITSSGLVVITDQPTISTTVAGSHRDLSVIRTNTTAAAVITYTVSGALFYLENAAPTVGAASTLTDSAIVMDVRQSNTAASTGVVAAFTQSAGAGAMQAITVVANSVTTVTAGVMSITANALTTGYGMVISSTSAGTTSGGLLSCTSATTGAVATNGLVNLVASGAYTSTANVGLLTLIANSTLTGTIESIFGNGLTTGVGLLISSTSVGVTSGSLLRVSTGTTGAVATNGVVGIVATAAYTSTANVGLLDVVANSTTAGTVFHLAGTGLTTGVLAYLDSGAGVYTGTGIITITGSGATTGSVVLLSNSGVMTAGGKLLELVAAGATTATAVMDFTLAALTTGTAFRITANALTTGSMITLVSSLAGMTAGSVSYLACNNGATDVFSIGVEGHIELRQTTAPTIASTIAAPVITAGSTDTCGRIETGGTPVAGSTITVTFNQAFTNPPRIFVQPVNANAGNPNTLPYVSATTTTTFTLTYGAAGTYAANPFYSYQAIETGVTTAV